MVHREKDPTVNFFSLYMDTLLCNDFFVTLYLFRGDLMEDAFGLINE